MSETMRHAPSASVEDLAQFQDQMVAQAQEQAAAQEHVEADAQAVRANYVELRTEEPIVRGGTSVRINTDVDTGITVNDESYSATSMQFLQRLPGTNDSKSFKYSVRQVGDEQKATMQVSRWETTDEEGSRDVDIRTFEGEKAQRMAGQLLKIVNKREQDGKMKVTKTEKNDMVYMDRLGSGGG